jgi:predicted O-methyltransferase YrrM
LYSIVRHIKPSVVVETGVGAGLSSAFILKALEDNKHGRLYSIDLANYEEVLANEGRIARAVAILPEHVHQGFIVPDALKHRWELLTGRTQELLPPLLRRLGSLDIFFHDGEHTYENMLFEYSAAWPFIRSGGLLLSDNITENRAFTEFSNTVGRHGVHFLLTPLGGMLK